MASLPSTEIRASPIGSVILLPSARVNVSVRLCLMPSRSRISDVGNTVNVAPVSTRTLTSATGPPLPSLTWMVSLKVPNVSDLESFTNFHS